MYAMSILNFPRISYSRLLRKTGVSHEPIDACGIAVLSLGKCKQLDRWVEQNLEVDTIHGAILLLHKCKQGSHRTTFQNGSY